MFMALRLLFSWMKHLHDLLGDIIYKQLHCCLEWIPIKKRMNPLSSIWNSGLALYKVTIYGNFSPLLHILQQVRHIHQQVSQFTADSIATESWNTMGHDHGSGLHSNFFFVSYLPSSSHPHTYVYIKKIKILLSKSSTFGQQLEFKEETKCCLFLIGIQIANAAARNCMSKSNTSPDQAVSFIIESLCWERPSC